MEEGAPIVMSQGIQEDAAPLDHQIAIHGVAVVDEHLLGHLIAILIEVGGASPGHLTDIQEDVHSRDHPIDIPEDAHLQGHPIVILGDALHLDRLTTTITTDGLRPGRRVVSPDDEPLPDRLITT